MPGQEQAQGDGQTWGISAKQKPDERPQQICSKHHSSRTVLSFYDNKREFLRETEEKEVRYLQRTSLKHEGQHVLAAVKENKNAIPEYFLC